MSVPAVDPLDHPDPWTEEEYLTLPHRHVELLDGSLLVSPWAGGAHQWLSSWVWAAFTEAAPPGLRVLESINLRVAPERILVPDLTVLTGSVARTVFPAADARLVVEITSPGNAFVDRGIKPQLYAQAGIPHYLRIELAGTAPTALVFALAGDAYKQTARFGPGETTVLDAPFPVSFDLSALLDS